MISDSKYLIPTVTGLKYNIEETSLLAWMKSEREFFYKAILLPCALSVADTGGGIKHQKCKCTNAPCSSPLRRTAESPAVVGTL